MHALKTEENTFTQMYQIGTYLPFSVRKYKYVRIKYVMKCYIFFDISFGFICLYEKSECIVSNTA